jgi:hypothetical protein
MSALLHPRAVVAAWKWWTGFGFVVAVGLGMSCVAYTDGLPAMFNGRGIDKAVHFTLAGLLAFFLDGALRRRTLFAERGIPIPVAAIAVLLPAAIEEYFQRYSELRTSSVWDFAADLAGVFVFTRLSRRAAQ